MLAPSFDMRIAVLDQRSINGAMEQHDSIVFYISSFL